MFLFAREEWRQQRPEEYRFRRAAWRGQEECNKARHTHNGRAIGRPDPRRSTQDECDFRARRAITAASGSGRRAAEGTVARASGMKREEPVQLLELVVIGVVIVVGGVGDDRSAHLSCSGSGAGKSPACTGSC